MQQEFVKLQIKKAIAATGLSQRTVYNRMERDGWKQEDDEQGRSCVYVPVSAIVHEEFLQQPATVQPSFATPAQPMQAPLQRDPKDAEIIALKDAAIADKDLLIQQLQERLAEKDNDLGNHKRQIQRYKDDEKRLDQLLQEVQLLQEAVQTPAKPWWKLW